MRTTGFLWTMIMLASCARAQAEAPPPSNQADARKTAAGGDSLFPERKPGGKVSLVRGVLLQLDPIHDQLQIRVFGGRDLRIAFDGQTTVLGSTPGSIPEQRLRSIPAGTVLSVDAVQQDGKLVAQSVRIGKSGAAELSGQVVRYDPTRSQLVLRDPINPEEVTLRMASGTTIVKRGQPESLQALAAGQLVRVQYSAAQNAAQEVEILAEPGEPFTFAGRILAVDLRSGVLTLSNDSDQTVRELALGSMDNGSIGQLREGADVSITAIFDGDHYAIRSVTLLPPPH